jgi:hypothetical protein
MLTSLSDSSITYTAPATEDSLPLRQKIEENTLVASATLMPEFKLSAGWRYKNREISDDPTVDPWTWHENGLLLGIVLQPSRLVRLNVNFDAAEAKSANSVTTSNSFTRESPNRSYRIRARASIKPANWIQLAVTGGSHVAKNTDPLVNHIERIHNASIAATIAPTEKLSLDLNYAYEMVSSRTDICYAFTANANAPLPSGAANAGTCTVANSPDNGSVSYYLDNDPYEAPTNFASGSINYSPMRMVQFNAGARFNSVDGSAHFLNPLMVPGSLQSRYVTPFSDVILKIAPQWSWHGNWTYNGYGETGKASPTLPLRNVHGNTVTLGVKYEF